MGDVIKLENHLEQPETGAGGTPAARRRRSRPAPARYLNLVNTTEKSAVLSDDALEAVHQASLTVLEEIGTDVVLPQARRRMKATCSER